MKSPPKRVDSTTYPTSLKRSIEFHGKPFLIILLLVSIHLLLRSLLLPHPFHLQQPPYVPPPRPPPPTVAAAPAATAYSYPPPPSHHHQFQRDAHQLFQRDAQTITPEALESVKAAIDNSDIDHKTDAKRNIVPRRAAG
ncbi:hypothetical protein Ahy_A04g019926 [Arachis hypogaea]|uniref:Uncharacterized protein n=1 Tax=Arachis hypogaea TaxID=3818 RepID=A0A445DGT0_ARAHY|nr:hypothetical protein Ahy_A04g019926 [Arachis hypogaea]